MARVRGVEAVSWLWDVLGALKPALQAVAAEFRSLAAELHYW